MILKREWPETDDLVIKKSGIKGKILSRNFNISRITSNFQVLADTLTKYFENFLNLFALRLEHPNHFSLFPENYNFLYSL